MISILILLCLIALLLIRPLRRTLITPWIFAPFRRSLPVMSATERTALNAGTVWWDGDLFSGTPDWKKFFALPIPTLSREEQAFMDNEVNAICAMIDDWQATTLDGDLTPAAWAQIKEQGFLGFIIPKQYGGLGFSAYAHSEIMTRLSTRSSALAVSVMVPNSLGPSELLLHYGTDAQKNYYLPRLAKGIEIPAFALTSPWAGSDAAAIPDSGIVCRGQYQGQEVLGLRVSWDKRYITLAPVCTVLGLAFRVYDPDHLIGNENDIGISCALIPHDHPGVVIGRRHLPLNAVFMNGPTQGKDVFIPMDFVIGGQKMLGQGWRMLMECLAVGRAISLPASNVGMAQLSARTVGAYARVRQQFNTAVANFEGVEEALARIAGGAYTLDAMRRMTAHAVDLGEKPAVLSAIAKYQATEGARRIVNDGMDVIGGKGVCLGPRNFLGRAYQQIPIGITVEGANILTRSLIIFGQGAIRCHPFVRAEMDAAQMSDARAALIAFDRAFFGHMAHVCKNAYRAFTRAIGLACTPSGIASPSKKYVRQINRYSAAFALLADMAMLIYGASLKRHEKISARLGDILSELYLSSAVIKRFHDQGGQKNDLALLHWSTQSALFRTQEAFRGVLDNLPCAWRVVLRGILFPLGFCRRPPSDATGQACARTITQTGGARDRLSASCFIPAASNDPAYLAKEPVYALEMALISSEAALNVEQALRRTLKKNPLPAHPDNNVRDSARAAHAAGLLSDADFAILQTRDQWRDVVIAVDDFAHDFLKSKA